MALDPNMLKNLLTGHLRGMQNSQKPADKTHFDDPELMNFAANDPKLWLGKQPASKKELKKAMNDLIANPAYVNFSNMVEKLSGVDNCVNRILKGFQDPEKVVNLSETYAKLFVKLEEANIPLENLKIINVICMGGTPYKHAGLGSDTDYSAETQFYFAKNFGFILNIVPFTFRDANRNLELVQIQVATIVLASLRARKQGKLRINGFYWGCKGTTGTIMGIRQFAPQLENPIAMIGFGTALQGYFDNDLFEKPSWIDGKDNLLPILVQNNRNDLNLGDGHADLTNYFSNNYPEDPIHKQIAHDFTTRKHLFKTFPKDPDHSWYTYIFETKADEVRHEVFQNISVFLNQSFSKKEEN